MAAPPGVLGIARAKNKTGVCVCLFSQTRMRVFGVLLPSAFVLIVAEVVATRPGLILHSINSVHYPVCSVPVYLHAVRAV